MAHDNHTVKTSKNQKRKSFQRHKRAQFDHMAAEKSDAAAVRKEQKKEVRKEKMEKKRKEYEGRVSSHEGSDENVQVVPAPPPPPPPPPPPRRQQQQQQQQQQQKTTAPAAVITTATTTAQQGRAAPFARPGWIVAPVQVHMNEAEKELAEHRAWVDRMCAPPPEAEHEKMPGEYFKPPQAGTAPNWAIEILEDFDNGFEMPF